MRQGLEAEYVWNEMLLEMSCLVIFFLLNPSMRRLGFSFAADMLVPSLSLNLCLISGLVWEGVVIYFLWPVISCFCWFMLLLRKQAIRKKILPASTHSGISYCSVPVAQKRQFCCSRFLCWLWVFSSCPNTYIQNLEKCYWRIYLQSSKGDTDKENGLMDMGEGRRGWDAWEE